MQTSTKLLALPGFMWRSIHHEEHEGHERIRSHHEDHEGHEGFGYFFILNFVSFVVKVVFFSFLVAATLRCVLRGERIRPAH